MNQPDGTASTPRNRSQSALAGSDEQFRLLVQGVIDYAIFMLDPAGYVSTWNFGAARIKGYAAEEIIGRHFSTFYTDEDKAMDMPARMLAKATKEGRAEAEGWRVRKDGTRFWANVVVDAIRKPHGEIIGFAKVTRDLTERRAAQEALEKAQAALAQTQKMEAIGQLTGGIAHDFNNLLTVISSNGELLGTPNIREREKRKLLDGILRAAERGSRLTQQLLAFARRQPLSPRTLSIRLLIGNFEPVLHRAGSSIARVEFDLSKQPDFTRIDAPQFEAALLNLIVNARDAMPDGGTIRVLSKVERLDAGRASTAGPDMKPGEYVVVSVEDDGVGMTPETVAKAFEPFYTTKEPGKGTGLGLSQVYGFVTQSGGYVDLDSSPGRGTTVRLYLPTDAEAQQKATLEDAQRRTSPLTVLLVEDDPDVMESAISMVQSLGYLTLTASDGVAALEILRAEPEIDVLFTDIVMPKGMSGVDLARQARAFRPTLKVLLASGYPMSALSDQHGLTDEFAFLSKPYRWSELSERLPGLEGLVAPN